MAHTHKIGDGASERSWQCTGPLTAAACDQAYADWQAMQAVLLAWKLALSDEKRWKKDRSPDATLDVQLVQYIAGVRPVITNKEGNPSKSPWVKRLLAAIERVKNGELPGYNLYELTTISAQGGTDAVHQRTTGVEPRVD